MQREELSEVLEAHALWLASGEEGGQRADLSGRDLRGVDLSRANLRGAFLHGAQLDGASLRGVELVHTDLRDAHLRGADLEEANLLLADFSGADLAEARLGRSSCGEEDLGHVRRGPRFSDANLRDADLRGAVLHQSDFSGANLEGVRFAGANLEGANLETAVLADLVMDDADLSEANLRGADLKGTSLAGARLVHADLRQADLSNANVERADLRSANLEEAKVDGIRYNRATSFRGVRAVSCYGSSRFRRFAQDQDFIEEFKAAFPVYYWIWLLLTDCGRSMRRVVLWVVILIGVFGLIYYLLGEKAFVSLDRPELTWSWFTAIYYSVCTFTIFGQGDVAPATPFAAVVVMTEVVVGYVMLGILISILATKVARRS
jgi:uncharacterized protein YjbI with pentapeptide repeats